ncbi:MFS transporter [Schumannella luteola]|uniref:MFS family permease n=1 Tax=Schumannella luteola TaxID=472059 RepID=A0A852YM38_9MICO|nr:MFS transporter [Schumannella luteola]NYG98809.1 MFS family permease [Schumannella luteola]TPX01927.1 MFS transporter [Schumannella luteola]
MTSTASLPLGEPGDASDAASAAPASDSAFASRPKPQIGLVLGSVLVLYLGQMMLNPLVAPLARQIGLAEWQIGLMVSISAITVVVGSSFWGRRSVSWGRRPVLAISMFGGATALLLFAVLAQLGVLRALPTTVLFVLLVIVRGLLYGFMVSAAMPTAQAYIADTTETEEQRRRGLGGLGAMQGLAMVLGAAAGGALAAFGLLVPIWIIPGLVLVGALLVVTRLRRETRHELIADLPKVSARDRRVWPFLLAGFGAFTALGLIQILVGFLVQDRFHLDPNIAATVTGGSLLAAGIGMVLAQAIIARRVSWSPRTLLIVGVAIALAGFVSLPFDLGLPLFVVANAALGLGLGLAMVGYTVGPTLLVSKREQGGLAGLTASTTALTFVITPTLGTALYGVWGPLPIVVAIAVLVLVLVFLLVHPAFRAASRAQRATPHEG